MDSPRLSFSARAVFLTVLAFAVSPSASAQTPEDAVRCLYLDRIKDTKVVDDNRVLFFLSRNRVYLNVLARNCEGLERSGAFGWTRSPPTRIPKLCSADWITVVEWGRLGSACPLGPFQSISATEAEALLAENRNPRAADPQPESSP